MMRKFEFDGNWRPKIELPALSLLCLPKLKSVDSVSPQMNKGLDHSDHSKVCFFINDSPSKNEYPEEIQYNAIEFILNNEETLYNTIFTILKNIIYPDYSERCGKPLGELFPIDTIDQMSEVLTLNEIYIDFIGRNNLAFTTYNFEWLGEQELGLSFLFEGAQMMKHDSASQVWYGGIIKDQDLQDFSSQSEVRYEKAFEKMYYPNSNKKYFKPWELEQTRNYLLSLVKNDQIDQFKEIVKGVNFDLNIHLPQSDTTLIQDIIDMGQLDLAQFMIDQGASIQGLLQKCGNFKTVEFFVQNGVDINELDERSQTLLDRFWMHYMRSINWNTQESDFYGKTVNAIIKNGGKMKLNPKNDNGIGFLHYYFVKGMYKLKEFFTLN